jgi:hypothetical protein
MTSKRKEEGKGKDILLHVSSVLQDGHTVGRYYISEYKR